MAIKKQELEKLLLNEIEVAILNVLVDAGIHEDKAICQKLRKLVFKLEHS